MCQRFEFVAILGYYFCTIIHFCIIIAFMFLVTRNFFFFFTDFDFEIKENFDISSGSK